MEFEFSAQVESAHSKDNTAAVSRSGRTTTCGPLVAEVFTESAKPSDSDQTQR